MMRHLLTIFVLLSCGSLVFAAAGAEAEQTTPFAGTFAQSIAAIVVFAVLLVLLKKKAWGPILKGLQDREQKIRSDLENAERLAKDAEQTLSDYRQQLADANVQVRKLIEQGRAEAQALATQMKQQTQDEISQMRDRAEADIRSAQQQAMNEVYEQTATLATQVAGQILRRQINAEDQQRLVDDALGELRTTRQN